MANLDVVVRLAGQDAGATGAISAVTSALRGLSGAAGTAVTPLSGLFGAVAGGVSVLSTLGFAAIGAQAALRGLSGAIGPVKLADDLNRAGIAFETLLGSARQANAFMEQIKSFAIATPFSTGELVKESQFLLAMGVSAEQVIPQLTAVGDAVAAMGGNEEQVHRINLALEQMSAKGRVSAQDMLQLTENNIPAWRLLSESMGLSVAQVRALSEAGKLEAAPAIQAILAGMERTFGGEMQANANRTLSGILSQIKDTFSVRLLLPFGEGIQSSVLPVLARFNTWLTENGASVQALGERLRTLGADISQHVVGAITTVKDLLSGHVSLGDVIAQIIGGGENLASALGTRIVSVVESIGGAVLGAFQRAEWVGQIAASLAQKVRAALPEIIDAFRSWADATSTWITEDAIPAIQREAPKLAIAISTAIQVGLADLKGTVGDTIRDALTPSEAAAALPQYQTWGAQIAGGLIVGINQVLSQAGIGQTVQQIGQSIVATLAPIAEALAPKIVALGQAFLLLADTVAAQLGPVLSRLGPVLSQLGQTWLPFLVVQVGNLIDLFRVFITVAAGVAAALGSALAGALQGLQQILQLVPATVKDATVVLQAVLAGDWTAAWNAAGKLVDDVLSGVLGLVQTGLATLGKVLSSAADVILPGWRDVWNSVGQVVSDVLRSMAASVTATTANFARGFALIGQGLQQALSGDVAGAWETAKQFWNASSLEIVKVTGDNLFAVAPVAANAGQGAVSAFLAAWKGLPFDLGSLSKSAATSAGADAARAFYGQYQGASGGTPSPDKPKAPAFNASGLADAAKEAERIAKEHWDRMNDLEKRGLDDAEEQQKRSLDARAQATKDALDQEIKDVKDAAAAEIAAREATRDAALRALDEQVQQARDAAEAEKRDVQDAETAAREATQRQREAERTAHDEAVREINDTRDARLAELDVQMQALNAQERLLKASEQARKNSEDLQKAEQDLATARQKGTGIGVAQTALGDVQQRIANDQRQAQLDQQKRDLEAQQKQVKDDADAARKILDDQQGAIQRQFADFNSFNVPGGPPGVNSETAGALSPAAGAVSPFEQQRRQIDDALKARLRDLDSQKQGIQDAAKADVDSIKARTDAAVTGYQDREQASKRFYDGEKQRIDDAFKLEKQRLDDLRFEYDHPELFGGTRGRFIEGGGGELSAGPGLSAGASTGFTGAPTGGTAGGVAPAAAGTERIIVQQTLQFYGLGQDDVAIVTRASRDGLLGALAAKGLTT